MVRLFHLCYRHRPVISTQFISFLTSPVLGLEDWCQLAWGNVPDHLGGAVRLPMLARHMERCVPILVLQCQARPFLHQVLHHTGQVQVGGQVQRALRVTKEKRITQTRLFEGLS